MINVKIDSERTVVKSTVKLDGKEAVVPYIIRTEDFFGLIYDTGKKHFPQMTAENSTEIVSKNVIASVLSRLDESPSECGNDAATYLFGIPEHGETLQFLLDYIEQREILTPTLREVEELRISCRMTRTFLPVIGNPEAIQFEGLRNAREVIVAVLYFYAYYQYNLVKCKHCGKWFATRNLKKQYCTRSSPCNGTIIKGDLRSCEQAVRDIRQNCKRLRASIMSKAAGATTAIANGNEFYILFPNACEELKEAEEKSPTAENLRNYYLFLKKVNKDKRWLVRGKIDSVCNEMEVPHNAQT